MLFTSKDIVFMPSFLFANSIQTTNFIWNAMRQLFLLTDQSRNEKPYAKKKTNSFVWTMKLMPSLNKVLCSKNSLLPITCRLKSSPYFSLANFSNWFFTRLGQQKRFVARSFIFFFLQQLIERIVFYLLAIQFHLKDETHPVTPAFRHEFSLKTAQDYHWIYKSESLDINLFEFDIGTCKISRRT